MEAAVNNALLDLAAKTANVPIYQYLGGPTRFKVRLLASLDGRDEASLEAPLRRAVSHGFKAFSVPIPARDAMMWQMQAYVDLVRRRVDRVREIAGAESDLVLDGAGSLMPGDAAFIATSLERNHLVWFDEPTTVHTTDALGKITAESVMPIGIGRDIHDIGAFQTCYASDASTCSGRLSLSIAWQRSAVWRLSLKFITLRSLHSTQVAPSQVSLPSTWQQVCQIFTHSKFPSPQRSRMLTCEPK